MSKQSPAQREFVRNLRVQNSILYQAKSTKPRFFQNIDIIVKTMNFNSLDDNPDSTEAKKVRNKNIGLLVITIIFELLAVPFLIIGFFIKLGKKY